MYETLTANIIPEKITNLIKNFRGVNDLIVSLKQSIQRELYNFVAEEGLVVGLRFYIDTSEKEIISIESGYCNHKPSIYFLVASVDSDGTLSRKKLQEWKLETMVLLWRQQRDDKEAYLEKRKQMKNKPLKEV